MTKIAWIFGVVEIRTSKDQVGKCRLTIAGSCALNALLKPDALYARKMIKNARLNLTILKSCENLPLYMINVLV